MDLYELSEERRIALRKIADFSSLVNPLGPSNRAKYAIRKALKELAFFPDEKGRRLKRLLSRLENVHPDHIFFGHGSEDLINKTLELVRPKRIALLGPLSRRKREILSSYELCQLQGGLEREALSANLESADLLFLSNPNEVTGSVLETPQTLSLIDTVEQTGKTLLIDESLRDFLPNPPSLSQRVALSPSAILIRSFSLFYGLCGLPFCMGIASREIARALQKGKISSLAYAAAIFSLKDKGFRKRTIAFIEEEKRFIKNALHGVLTLEVLDTPVNFLIVRIKDRLPDIEERFLDRNMIIEAEREEGRTVIRLPIKKHKFNALFVRVLKSILSA